MSPNKKADYIRSPTQKCQPSLGLIGQRTPVIYCPNFVGPDEEVDKGQSKPYFVIIKIGIDCSLDDVDITAELRVIGGLVYSTVTFQSHPRCNLFPIVNVRLLNKVLFKESICIYTAQITKLVFN